MKPTRHYKVCVGPTVQTAGDGVVEVIEPTSVHNVHGCEFKWLTNGSDLSFFQIIDKAGSIVFAAPAISILWVNVVEDLKPNLAVIRGIPDGVG